MAAGTVCEGCASVAREAALTNYLEANVLRWPDMDRPGCWRYEELTEVQEAEVEEWALALVETDAEALGWHELHQEVER